MVKSNLAKLMKEKKLTYRRLSELSGIAGETINRARGILIYECKLSTLDALAKRMSGIHLAIPVFSKGYRPKQGKVAP